MICHCERLIVIDVLIQAELMDKSPEVIFLCIVPETYDGFGVEMAMLMRDRFDLMEDLLLKELAAYGRIPEKVV